MKSGSLWFCGLLPLHTNPQVCPKDPSGTRGSSCWGWAR